MTPLKNSRAGLRGLLAARWKVLRGSPEAGQALVFALIVVLMIGLLPAIVLSSLNQEMPLASEAVTAESALAAAEAGVQEYSNLMDQYPGYYNYVPQANGAQPTGTDAGMPGGSNMALGAWQAVTPSNPPESFTYYPDTSELSQTQTNTNPFGSDILLVVTGSAGTGKATQYRRIEAAFSLSGVITDVYFSNYEQPGSEDLDQWGNTYSGCSSPGHGCSLVSSGSHQYDEAEVTTPCTAAGVCYSPSEAMATALCQYDADSVNTFIDWYSANIKAVDPQPGYPGYDTATPYSAANPYYGPWYGSFVDPNTTYEFGDTPATGSSNNGDNSACPTNYWITGDTFNGPVYSNDELTTCGAPAFTANPGLQVSVPKSFFFPAEKTAGGALVGWPGAQPPVANPTVPMVGPPYVSFPYGYDKDPWGDCSGGGDAPTFKDPQSPRLGISQPLPPANQSLINEVEAGSVAGCVYTGPTMIRFTYSTTAQTEMMDVWSPLTQDTYSGVNAPPSSVDAADGVNCGTTSTTGVGDLCAASPCTAANMQVNSTNTVVAGNFAQVPLTVQEVIVVQNTPTSVTDPNYWNITCSSSLTTTSCIPNAEPVETTPVTPTTTPGGALAGCIDPWVNPDSGLSITPASCAEGDAIISGAVGAQATLSASNDIVLARSVVYGCAVPTTNPYTSAYDSTLTAPSSCASSSNVLGLIALNDIWMARPYNPTTRAMAPSCARMGAGNTNDDVDLQPASISWNDMIPDCTVVNPTVDAAMASLTGFFEVEYWREGDATGGTITFNGSDAVNNSGQFGVFSPGGGLAAGYLLTLNYDSRLRADPPPQYLPATDGVWNEVGWVTCSNTVPNPNTTGYPSGGVPACTSLANSYPPPTT
jgi:Tfp pilus assembly protein PilX